MATLEELLALLPDNTTGQIDAADLRTVVTELWNLVAVNTAATQSNAQTILNIQGEGQELEARVSALELTDTSGTTISVTGTWQANPQANANPGGGQVSCDTGDFDSATLLRFAPIDKNNQDLTLALQRAVGIFAQQKMDASNWVRYTVTGAAVVGSYVEVTVTVLGDSGGATGAAAWQDAIVVLGGIPV